MPRKSIQARLWMEYRHLKGHWACWRRGYHRDGGFNKCQDCHATRGLKPMPGSYGQNRPWSKP